MLRVVHAILIQKLWVIPLCTGSAGFSGKKIDEADAAKSKSESESTPAHSTAARGRVIMPRSILFRSRSHVNAKDNVVRDIQRICMYIVHLSYREFK
jgi:hypothetical protein